MSAPCWLWQAANVLLLVVARNPKEAHADSHFRSIVEVCQDDVISSQA